MDLNNSKLKIRKATFSKCKNWKNIDGNLAAIYGFYFDNSTGYLRCLCCSFGIYDVSISTYEMFNTHNKLSPNCPNCELLCKESRV